MNNYDVFMKLCTAIYRIVHYLFTMYISFFHIIQIQAITRPNVYLYFKSIRSWLISSSSSELPFSSLRIFSHE